MLDGFSDPSYLAQVSPRPRPWLMLGLSTLGQSASSAAVNGPAFLIPALHQLPGFPAGREGNLAFRNLKRGVLLGLPSGQTIAAHMKVTPLTKAQLSSGPDGAAAAAHGLIEQTPLWYYILKEAEQIGGGEHLGPVGKTIIAEVFIGLVAGDPQSYLSATPQWTPSGIGPVDGRFTFADLLSVVGDINPLGDG